MPQYTTTTTIHTLDDIYNFRVKIYDAIGLLCGEKTQASRLSSGLSSGLKLLLFDKGEYQLETNVDIQHQKAILQFKLPIHESMLALIDPFFETVQEISKYEVHCAQSFHTQRNTEELMAHLSTVLAQKTKEELEREMELKNQELNVAKSIQFSMLPVVFPAFPDRLDIDIHAQLIPAKEVGGDLYDFYFLDPVNLAIVVGDVSGKGVPAALMMAVCKTLLKSRASTDKSTGSILTHVNNELAKDNKNYMFVTVFMAILNTSTGELTYSNAGHNPTYIKKKNGELYQLKELHGPVIAAMEDMIYGQSTVQLDKGDVLFAYTDGVTEAHNTKGELFSDKRLHNLLLQHPFTNPELLVKEVIDTIQLFESGSDQFDDITALCLEYKGLIMEKTAPHKHFTISNEIEQVPNAIQLFEEFAEQYQLPFAIIMKISIVFDELLSNIIKYSFTDGQIHLIEIAIRLDEKSLHISFSDEGMPFNPFQKTPPDVNVPIEEREIGGLGIHLVRELMNEYTYKREHNKNIVYMTKYL